MKNTKTIIRTFCFIFILFFVFSKEILGHEWLEYAVVLKTTGSEQGDRKQIERYRYNLAKTALSFRGTPYVWGGESVKGMDCSGFMKMVYKLNGVTIPRVSFDQGSAGAPIKRNLKSLKTGDLIYFKQERRSGWPHHVGMYLWDGYFIHCTSSTGVTVESLYTSKLSKSVKSISRIVFTQREGQILTLANQYGLLTADSGVYDPETGRVVQ